jgi:DNA-binding PadR family transcriptional regulator
VSYISAPMKRVSEMTAQKLVLGFVADEPDTRQNILYQFNDRFASAGFPKTAGYNSLKELVEKRELRLVDGIYEATPQGKRSFREWMLGPGPSPGIRAVILGKLEFVTVADLETVVGILKEEEAAYKLANNEVTGRVQNEQRKRLRERDRGHAQAETFEQRLRSIQNKHEANLWTGAVENLEDLREELETLLEDLAAGKVPCA